MSVMLAAAGMLAGSLLICFSVVGREIGGWLALLPRGVLRLAATRCDHARRTMYQEEWLAELAYIEREAEGLPITRLARGIRFALGVLTVRWPEHPRERRFQRLGRRFARASAWRITDIAAALAGRKRPALHDEWRAHLAGKSGHDPASCRKVKQATGFLISAVRYRCSDAADAAWAVADGILRSRTLSNLVVLAPTAAAAYLVLGHEGTLGVVQSAESIGAIGGTMYALIRTGRWWRNVKPPEPKAHRAKE